MKERFSSASVWKLQRLICIAAACFTASGFVVYQAALAQEHPAAASASSTAIANTTFPIGSSDLAPAAYVHYLLALKFATDGINHEALREAAASLRAQRESNPAAGLAFQLITEQRQDVHIKLCCLTANIVSARYSADGSRILTVLDDKTVRIWDAHTGMQTAGPIPHEDDVLAAAWSADGRRIVTSSRNATVYLWTQLPVILYMLHSEQRSPFPQSRSVWMAREC
ncbi:WD40 repeat domain-containing protein [Edaphobacter modestus]|uniref:WD domain G-beta repeat uncharacterized protein n=1 Tax=Edaphobacter modestus TaxID=388466 RepID=A0A4Q7YPZ5_9BACT|nr:hypothetical protein [Edaphobacter modestus]RZU38943.1 WD domain G-beta repeat uncharacterized protein [Edaphobacter modestus]